MKYFPQFPQFPIPQFYHFTSYISIFTSHIQVPIGHKDFSHGVHTLWLSECPSILRTLNESISIHSLTQQVQKSLWLINIYPSLACHWSVKNAPYDKFSACLWFLCMVSHLNNSWWFVDSERFLFLRTLLKIWMSAIKHSFVRSCSCSAGHLPTALTSECQTISAKALIKYQNAHLFF